MKTEPNHPSTPIANIHGSPSLFSYVTQSEEMTTGLTKREHFAGLAMQGIMANQSCYTLKDNQKAEYAIIMADLLIAELNRTQD
jgi:hypothetical protein